MFSNLACDVSGDCGGSLDDVVDIGMCHRISTSFCSVSLRRCLVPSGVP